MWKILFNVSSGAYTCVPERLLIRIHFTKIGSRRNYKIAYMRIISRSENGKYFSSTNSFVNLLYSFGYFAKQLEYFKAF
ncbi:hypothetical protein P8452_59005 [Trifolium repens]|nr:hypothetical protein P8452_59005 [Trifolium repens]